MATLKGRMAALKAWATIRENKLKHRNAGLKADNTKLRMRLSKLRKHVR